jgi:hypothetical protein
MTVSTVDHAYRSFATNLCEGMTISQHDAGPDVG